MSDSTTEETSHKGGFSASAGMVFAVVLSGSLFIGIAELSRHIAWFLPLTCYAVVLLFGTLAVLGGTQIDVARVRRTVGGRIPAVIVNVSFLLFTAIVFGLLCRELWLRSAGGFAGTSNDDRAEWIGFGFDNFFEALFLDIPGIYDLHLSSALPASFVSRTLVFAYRVLLDFAVIKIVLRFWQSGLSKAPGPAGERE